LKMLSTRRAHLIGTEENDILFTVWTLLVAHLICLVSLRGSNCRLKHLWHDGISIKFEIFVLVISFNLL
jgi:hypothetical protein